MVVDINIVFSLGWGHHTQKELSHHMVGIEFFFCAHIMRGFRISRKLQKDNLICDEAHASMIGMDSIIFSDFKTKLKLNKRLGFW